MYRTKKILLTRDFFPFLLVTLTKRQTSDYPQPSARRTNPSQLQSLGLLGTVSQISTLGPRVSGTLDR